MIYFDSAATSIKPDYVLNTVYNFSKDYNANIHRGVCKTSQDATDLFEQSRKYIADFINAKSEREIIFTSGTTYSLNLLAYSVCKSFDNPKRDIIITTEMEHTSNVVAWQKYCIDTKKKKLFFVPLLENGLLDYNNLENFLNKNGNRVFLLTITHISNAIGTVNDIKYVIDLCHKYGILVSIDAAQSIAHEYIDVQELNCDFLSFSGHKVFAPFGTGILYAKEFLLKNMQPMFYGGGAVSQVRLDDTKLATYPQVFEAGTPNISGFIGLHAALYWFADIIGRKNAFVAEKQLYDYAIKNISTLPNFKIIGSPEYSKSIIAIVHNNIDAKKVATILSNNNICVRSGYLCTHTLINKLNLANKGGIVRISLCFENTKQEIDYLVQILKTIL
jgi:cysteine desulfurase / selenocysteine lyase